MLALPISAGGALLARPFLQVVYGADYEPATTALRLLFLMSGVMFFSSYFGSELLAGQRQRTYLVGVGAGAVLNVALNLLLIPKFSLNGAAAATLASESVVCLFMCWQTRRDGVVVADLILRAALPGGAMAAAVATLMAVAPPYVAAAGGVLVYSSVLAAVDGGTIRQALRRQSYS
jgi:O-antigen/teichoic acid export membrane protein